MQGDTARVGGCLSVVGLRTRHSAHGPMVMETRAPGGLQIEALSISEGNLRAYVRFDLGRLRAAACIARRAPGHPRRSRFRPQVRRPALHREHGLRKPNPELARRVAAAVDVQIEECWFVGNTITETSCAPPALAPAPLS